MDCKDEFEEKFDVIKHSRETFNYSSVRRLQFAGIEVYEAGWSPDPD